MWGIAVPSPDDKNVARTALRLPRLILLALQLLSMHEMNTGRTTEATVIP